MQPRIHNSLIGLLAFLTLHASGVERDLSGQLSGWVIGNHVQEEWQHRFGARYVPQLTLLQPVTTETFVDLEASANGWITSDSETDDIDSDLTLYRLKLRFATPQTETRLGLQQLNFGPARLLRALRWFDQLDQRDPQRMTDGVYALLFRYTALNNANVWAWGLYGNDAVKGFERLPSVKDKTEFGGRLQYPVFGGELAATLHMRTVTGNQLNSADFPETRLALDGRWDKGVGMWFESVIQQQDAPRLPYEWTTMTMAGLDYTVGIGNGLYVVLEHLLTASSAKPFGADEDAQMSAYLLSYPIGLFDSLSAIGFYNWDSDEYSQHLSWQRAYDNLVIDVSLFRYPDADQATLQTRQQSGYGGQLLLMYHH